MAAIAANAAERRRSEQMATDTAQKRAGESSSGAGSSTDMKKLREEVFQRP